MTLTKKHWIIIGVALVAIYFIFIRKRKYSESSFDAALPLLGENGYDGLESGYSARNCPGGQVRNKEGKCWVQNN